MNMLIFATGRYQEVLMVWNLTRLLRCKNLLSSWFSSPVMPFLGYGFLWFLKPRRCGTGKSCLDEGSLQNMGFVASWMPVSPGRLWLHQAPRMLAAACKKSLSAFSQEEKAVIETTHGYQKSLIFVIKYSNVDTDVGVCWSGLSVFKYQPGWFVFSLFFIFMHPLRAAMLWSTCCCV